MGGREAVLAFCFSNIKVVSQIESKSIMNIEPSSRISRRTWIKSSIIGLGLPLTVGSSTLAQFDESALEIGIVTDVHYADKGTLGNQYYRDFSVENECSGRHFQPAKTRFCGLGDLIDGHASTEADLKTLSIVETAFSRFNGVRHYVLGNHDLLKLAKDQFIEHCGAKNPYYSFDRRGYHFVVLDACFNQDNSDYKAGNFNWTEAYVSKKELAWLETDLQQTSHPTVIFTHQRLDDENSPYGVKNGPVVRNILQQSQVVIAVFQGHNHIWDYRSIYGIHYFSLLALVEGAGLENKAYSILSLHRDRRIVLEGEGANSPFRNFIAVDPISQRLTTWKELKSEAISP